MSPSPPSKDSEPNLSSEEAAEIASALGVVPKSLTPKWLYDDRGSELFSEITLLEEYYLTEAERGLLVAHSAEIASLSQADTLVELGSGTSDKTRTLLDAFSAAGSLRRFVPLDVSPVTLHHAAVMLEERYPSVEILPVVGDFTQHLDRLPTEGTRLVAFLGSTLGNFHDLQRQQFFDLLGRTLGGGEWLLLGVDLVKDIGRIVDAYNDSFGATEAFIKNVLTVLNREFGGDLSPDDFDYVALWDSCFERVDMRLRARVDVHARFEGLNLDVSFGAGEELRVEVSTKFRIDRLSAELGEAGFEVAQVWDAPGPTINSPADFALILARRR